MEVRNEPPSPEELRREIELLKGRLAQLESTVRDLREGGGISTGKQRDSATSQAANATAHVVSATEQSSKVIPLKGKEQQSLETRIGSQVFNRVGIIAVLFAMGWFLKLAIDLNWVGSETRVSIGLLSSIGLVLWSERFRQRGFVAFAYSLKALATGIAYLSLWAAFTLYSMMPAWAAFACMAAVTAANGILAWVQNSELLASYALVGGYITPVLLSVGRSHEVFLFSYLLLLDIATVLLLLRRNWLRLAILALLSTTLYFFGWVAKFYHATQLGWTVFFLFLFFLCFAIIPVLLLPRLQQRNAKEWLRIWPIVVSLITWFQFLFLSLSSNGRSSHRQAVFSMVLALASVAFSLLPQARTGRGRIFADTHFLIASIALLLASWLGLEHFWIVLAWLAEGLLLICFAVRFRLTSLRVAAGIVLLVAFLGLLVLEFVDPLPEPVSVLWNAHFGTYIAGLLTYAAVVALALRFEKQKEEFCPWINLAGAATVAFNIAALIAGSFEIHHYWSCGDRTFGDLCETIGPLDLVYARFSLSAWMMIYGACLMTVGFLTRRSFLRWQALILLLVSIGKVFLYDASKLSQGYRVLSFLVLGVLLLGVSYAYQRDFLSLRTVSKEKY
jgi:uncharacterized membrane protein